MTVPNKGKRVSPAEHLQRQMEAREERIKVRRAAHKRALLWAEERAKVAIPREDPAYWFVMERLADDRDNGYKVNEPWCFEGRLKIHLTRFHEITQAEGRNRVYYIKVGKYIKIGTSVDVDKRLRQYPPDAELLATEPGGYDREAERHKQFRRHLAARQEWFSPGEDLMRHITNLQRIEHEQLPSARQA